MPLLHLNWENRERREEIYKMVNYWLDKGLGGFRIDAISNIKKRLEFGLFHPDGEDELRYIGDWILNQPGIEEFLRKLNEKTFRPHNSMTVAEANVPEDQESVVKIPEGYDEKVIGNYDGSFFNDGRYCLKPYECIVLHKKDR